MPTARPRSGSLARVTKRDRTSDFELAKRLADIGPGGRTASREYANASKPTIEVGKDRDRGQATMGRLAERHWTRWQANPQRCGGELRPSGQNISPLSKATWNGAYRHVARR